MSDVAVKPPADTRKPLTLEQVEKLQADVANYIAGHSGSIEGRGMAIALQLFIRPLVETTLDLYTNDFSLRSWARHLGVLFRRPKRHTIDELAILTDDLVALDERVRHMRKGIRDRIEALSLEENIIGREITAVDLRQIMRELDAMAGDRAFHQDFKTAREGKTL